jgi:hypothetical protein
LLILHFRKIHQLSAILPRLEKCMKLKISVLQQFFQIRETTSPFLTSNFKTLVILFMYAKPALPIYGAVMRCWPLRGDKRILFYKDIVLMQSALDGQFRLYYRNVEITLQEFLLPAKNFIHGKGGWQRRKNN